VWEASEDLCFAAGRVDYEGSRGDVLAIDEIAYRLVYLQLGLLDDDGLDPVFGHVGKVADEAKSRPAVGLDPERVAGPQHKHVLGLYPGRHEGDRLPGQAEHTDQVGEAFGVILFWRSVQRQATEDRDEYRGKITGEDVRLLLSGFRSPPPLSHSEEIIPEHGLRWLVFSSVRRHHDRISAARRV
jgi:hypothetical protein